MPTRYKQFGTNWIIVLLSAESQTAHIQSGCTGCNKNWSVVLLNKKLPVLLYQVYCVWQGVKTRTVISNGPVYKQYFIIHVTKTQRNTFSIND
jgi:hypothetical protein